jgi:hypothetical protein
MHVDVQGVLPVGGEVVCMRKVHVLLTAVRSEQHTFTVTHDPEVGVVSHRWDGTGNNDGHREWRGQDQATPHNCLHGSVLGWHRPSDARKRWMFAHGESTCQANGPSAPPLVIVVAAERSRILPIAPDGRQGSVERQPRCR